MRDKGYEPPTVKVLGSVRDLTQVGNKVGPNADVFTAATGGQIVGSVVGLP